MAKKKKKKKLKRKISLFFIVLILGALAFWYFNKTNNDIVLVDDLNFELGSKVTISDIIESSKYKILNGDDVIDTDKLGTKEVLIKYKKNNKNSIYASKIKIIDNEAPVISCDDTINVNVGAKIKIEDMIDVTDNSGNDVKISVEGDYDLGKKGEKLYKEMVGLFRENKNFSVQNPQNYGIRFRKYAKSIIIYEKEENDIDNFSS